MDSHKTVHQLKELTLNSEQIFQGKVISVQVDEVRLPNGGTSTREIVKHNGAVAILAIVDDRMIIVQQYRKALEEVTAEIPAGKLDSGEDPIAAAHRELREETGYRTDTLRHISSFYTAPGFSDEIVHLYFSDQLQPADGGQKLDPDEFLHCGFVTMDEALGLIQDRSICDAKTMFAVHAWNQYCRTGDFLV